MGHVEGFHEELVAGLDWCCWAISSQAEGGTKRSDSINTNWRMAARLSQAGTESMAACTRFWK
jgi:hypothetical protein